MRCDLVIFDLDVLNDRNARPPVAETLQELTDLGVTLGLVSELPETAVRDLLGPAQQQFDALECDRALCKTGKFARIIGHLESSSDRVLVAMADAADIAVNRRLSLSFAVMGGAPFREVSAADLSTHVVAALSDVVDIVSGRPLLRIVR